MNTTLENKIILHHQKVLKQVEKNKYQKALRIIKKILKSVNPKEDPSYYQIIQAESTLYSIILQKPLNSLEISQISTELKDGNIKSWLSGAIQTQNNTLGYFACKFLEFRIDYLLGNASEVKEKFKQIFPRIIQLYNSTHFKKDLRFHKKGWITMHLLWHFKPPFQAYEYGLSLLEHVLEMDYNCTWVLWIGIELIIFKVQINRIEGLPDLYERMINECGDYSSYESWEARFFKMTKSIINDNQSNLLTEIKEFIDIINQMHISFFLYSKVIKYIVLNNYERALHEIGLDHNI